MRNKLVNDDLKDYATHKSKQPKEYDLVLGGNNPPPTDGLVLGGIEGLNLQFNNADSEDEKIAILHKALAYGEAGEAWLFDLVATENNKIQWLAAILLSHTKNEVYKQLLLEYFAEFIPNNINSWNEYKQTLPNFKINLSRINLSGAKLYGIDLSKVILDEADLSNIDFSVVSLNDINRVNLREASLRNANLRKAYFYESNLFKTDLSQANLEEANIVDAKLKQLNLENANLTKTVFYGAELDEVNLSNAIFVKTDFRDYACIKNMVFDSSYDFKETRFLETDFKNVTFSNVNLKNISFSGSLFKNTTFDNCNLTSAEFYTYKDGRVKLNLIFKEYNLENVDFKLSNLKGVKFDRVNLKGADFRWSDLTGVDFTGLDVRGANFTRCAFGNNNLDKADTEGAKFSSVDSPRFPPRDLNTSKLKGALFNDQHYYEPGYE